MHMLTAGGHLAVGVVVEMCAGDIEVNTQFSQARVRSGREAGRQGGEKRTKATVLLVGC